MHLSCFMCNDPKKKIHVSYSFSDGVNHPRKEKKLDSYYIPSLCLHICLA